jgi:DNA-binding NarL/FixJ family response regulator
LVDDFRSRIKSANRLPRFATLTSREREVLKMLAEGNSVKEIACTLNLSVKTVEAHPHTAQNRELHTFPVPMKSTASSTSKSC